MKNRIWCCGVGDGDEMKEVEDRDEVGEEAGRLEVKFSLAWQAIEEGWQCVGNSDPFCGCSQLMQKRGLEERHMKKGRAWLSLPRLIVADLYDRSRAVVALTYLRSFSLCSSTINLLSHSILCEEQALDFPRSSDYHPLPVQASNRLEVKAHMLRIKGRTSWDREAGNISQQQPVSAYCVVRLLLFFAS